MDWLPGFLRLPVPKVDETVLTQRGQFGDAFGAFNALVSTFALIGLFYTIKSQQDQLTTQDRIGHSNDLLVRQQQFQEQFYRAVDAYRELLAEVTVIDADQVVHKGRVALNEIWRHRFLASIRADSLPQLRAALMDQLEALRNEGLGSWNTNDRASKSVTTLVDFLRADSNAREEALRLVGAAWSSVYLANRFQLDALFRSWYTAYRILGTATRYALDSDSVRLYSAVFRAQLSWVEMAFLLANQTGLPQCGRFPKACAVSNAYATYDNLDSGHDAVVATLKLSAEVNSTRVTSEISLTSQAFGEQGPF